MIRPSRTGIAAAAVLLAGCSSPAPAAPDEAAARGFVETYNKALLARDFATACRDTSAAAVGKLVAGAKAQGLKAGSCEEAFASVYAVPQAATALDAAARSVTVTGVAVTGDDATVTYQGTAGGQQKDGLTVTLHRANGTWQVT